ncbi:DedA family protein [Sporolactobacillus terrae]|uniref:DedA family protein n=1 Tax=Sporolactobacillus terrae TaxID=269673 RepID=A0A410DC18_9BACL|nr:DedA family protein [Sporolactobacillus terrae]QAA23572.1 DedA family protein [Sporolactobacillus terrae]QAA26542.1 DedA family protein [Sporolactobacillus terrae]UAK15616.1 DedA family protein [Sporolactobacillus terrae]BBO00077.1 putative membrane protein YbfM [Sporolactobacillus terrae]
MEQFQSLFYTYGYFFVFLFLFCGLIGVPAAEESFLLFVGVTLSQVAATAYSLNLTLCILMAVLGASSGMVSAYLIGFYIGEPFIERFGKYIGLTEKRWKIAQKRFQQHTFLAIIAGYFIPGVRQINPYLAGLSRARFASYLPATILGAIVWSTLFLMLGYYMGNQIRQLLGLGLLHVMIIAVVLLIGFIIVTIVQVKKR